MMYFRYFRVTGGVLVEEAIRRNEALNDMSDRCQAVADSVGAETAYIYKSGNIAGFAFKEPPDTAVWKKTRTGHWMPKRNCKKGKEISEQLRKLPRPGSVQDSLQTVGLFTGPVVIRDGMGYRPVMSGRFEPTPIFFVKVPWADETPEDLEEYIKDREAGTRGSVYLDHLLWTPPPEWKEIKEWQMLKEIEELNDEP